MTCQAQQLVERTRPRCASPALSYARRHPLECLARGLQQLHEVHGVDSRVSSGLSRPRRPLVAWIVEPETPCLLG